MREAAEKLKPDVMIHLGDYYDDGMALSQEYPQIPFYQVPGNCDRFRCDPGIADILIETIGGVKFYLTHGHRHGVKMGTERLISHAIAAHADAVLYGHTHTADCRREPEGLWIMNPGSCGSFGGSVGLITVDGGKIVQCTIIRALDLQL